MKYLLCIILSLVIAGYATAQQTDPIPQHETFTIASTQVGETRTINVWTPPEYASSTDSLPVMYMADGGIQEDFSHIANTMAELIAAKKVPPFILVGIENTQRRRDLTGPTEVKKDKTIAPVVGGSEKFRAFIKEELFTEINHKYRTTHKKGILGESLSGLFVMETFMLYPELFDYYIAFDPSLWWNNKYLLKNAETFLAKMPATQQKRLWFAGSDAKDIYGATRDLEKVLKNQRLPQLIWHYSDEPKEQHQTIFRATKEKALIWTLGGQ